MPCIYSEKLYYLKEEILIFICISLNKPTASAMKRISILLTGLFFITMVNAQFRSAGLVVGAGYTLVDIEDAIDYSPLEDWDHFAVVIKALGEYEMNP